MKSEQKYFLLKSEPSTYSIDQLKQDKTTAWTGVRNYQARNNLMAMQVGDLCLFYHSSCTPAGVAGIAKVASKPYPDPTQFDMKSEYYDTKSTKEKPRWFVVDVAFVKKFKNFIPLVGMKNDPALTGMKLFQASRLSVQPVSGKHFKYIVDELTK